MTSAAPTSSSSRSTGTRESFTGQKAFILTAIGSAVGLGNIWRFPYVAYENGGGAFLVPYLIALLTAGLPILFFDYAIGHKYRGSPPLALKRLNRSAEVLGWFKVGVCFLIALYYAAIIAWAACYAFFSFTLAWGDDPEGFFFERYLESNNGGVEGGPIAVDFVAQVGWPLIAVWVVTLVCLALGVKRGIAMASIIGMPVLFVMFFILVAYSVTLDGAVDGLNQFFTPDWGAMTDPQIWIQAYGHIFFSLSIGFGIMITYASYLKQKSNATGSGLVVGFANSSFEILAGIGVFAALGFLAFTAGTGVDEVVSGGIGLAFIGFPAIISEAPASALVGVLFFGSLVFAGITSQISILEVVISAVKDKTGWSRPLTVGIVGGITAVLSVVLIGGVSGITILDIVDAFANNIGIVAGALIAVVLVSWVYRKLPVFAAHLNQYGSFKLGTTWYVLLGVVVPIVLGALLITDVRTKIVEGYGGFDSWAVGIFGWGAIGLVVVFALVMTLLPWSSSSALYSEAESGEAAQRSDSTRKATAGASSARADSGRVDSAHDDTAGGPR
jgi:NSS family neurotransmitter:Na+ symporter